jgi:hypothetical protein
MMYVTFGCNVTPAAILNFDRVLDTRPQGVLAPVRIFVQGGVSTVIYIMFPEKVDWDIVMLWFGYVLMNTRSGFAGMPTHVLLVPNEDEILKSMNVINQSIVDVTMDMAAPVHDPCLTVRSIRSDKFKVSLSQSWNMNVIGTVTACGGGTTNRWFEVACCAEFIEQLKTIERAIQTAIPDCDSIITRTRALKFTAKPYVNNRTEQVFLDGEQKTFEDMIILGRLYAMVTVHIPYAFVKNGALIPWLVIKYLTSV